MSPTNYQERPPSRVKVAAVVMFYMVSALVMIFVNKAVLNSTPDLPFTFLFVQMVIAIFLLHILSFVVPKGYSLKPKVAIPELSAEMAYKLMPVVSIGVIALVFNTLCLRNVDASFFQIARGLLLPFTIILSSLQTRHFPRSNIVRAACLVTMGFFIGISPGSFFRSSEMVISDDGEILPPSAEAQGLDGDKVLALIYGSLSALMTAIHAVMIKDAVRKLDGSVLRLTYWSNLMSSVFLFPCILLNGEASIFIQKFIIPSSTALLAERQTFITGSLVTGLFGFLLGLAGLLSIKVTSPITHMVTSATRSVLQTLLAVLVFGEIVTERRALSIGVITVGAVYYTWVQSSSPPVPLANVGGGRDGLMKDLASAEKGGQEEDSPSVKASWTRGHGTTASLATLLPLHAPKAIRASPPFGHSRLGSISEEEEEYNNSLLHPHHGLYPQSQSPHQISFPYEDSSSSSSRSSSGPDSAKDSWDEKMAIMGGIGGLEKIKGGLGLVPEDDLISLSLAKSRSRSPGAYESD